MIKLLSELVVYDSFDFNEFLKKLIKIITKIIQIDSCLIYLFNTSNNELILIASKKPHAKLIGNIKMKSGEGITGWVVKHKKRVVIQREAYKDPRFKQFDELPEDKFEAFLSIPIFDKTGAVGVINLQNKKETTFGAEEISVLEAVVQIVASAFQNAILGKQVNLLRTKLEDRTYIEKAKGILMKKNGLSEKEAYELIRSEAMKKRKSKREIADAVLLIWG